MCLGGCALFSPFMWYFNQNIFDVGGREPHAMNRASMSLQEMFVACSLLKCLKEVEKTAHHAFHHSTFIISVCLVYEPFFHHQWGGATETC
jgi:hypothetical protein